MEIIDLISSSSSSSAGPKARANVNRKRPLEVSSSPSTKGQREHRAPAKNRLRKYGDVVLFTVRLKIAQCKRMAHHLHTHGAIVVPVSPQAVQAQEVWQAMDTFPEYRSDQKGPGVQRVLGGFGALGNPSSFHHPSIRRLRRLYKTEMAMPIMRQYAKLQFGKEAKNIRLEALFDRLCVRCEEFGQPVPEGWHRDIYDGEKYNIRKLPASLPNGEADMIFGGWTNLSSQDQYFVGLLGSHDTAEARKAQQQGGGFAALSDTQIKAQRVDERLRAQRGNTYGSCSCNQFGHVTIPPGHALIFFQRLLHSVKGGTQPTEPSLRLFHGYRLTTETVSLMAEQERIISEGGVPRIPSGQVPPMYSANHYAWFNKEDPVSIRKYRNWAERTFVPQCLFKRTTKSGRVYYTPTGPGDSKSFENRNRCMASLNTLGLMSDEYKYTKADLQTLLPTLL